MGQYLGKKWFSSNTKELPNPFDFTHHITYISTMDDYSAMTKVLFYDKITCGRLVVLRIFTRQLCLVKPHLLPVVEVYNSYAQLHGTRCRCDLSIDTTGFD